MWPGISPGAGFAVSEENKRVLHEVCPWWRGQTVQDRCYGMFTDEQKALLATGIIKAEGNMTSGDAHLAVNYPLLLEKGLDLSLIHIWTAYKGAAVNGKSPRRCRSPPPRRDT